MSSSRWDYFTYWNAAATAVGYTALAATRCAGRPQPWLAVYLVVSALVVCIIGTWVLAFRMRIPKRFHRAVLRSQLWLHVAPLVAAFFLVGMWPALVGRRATPSDAWAGLVGLAVLFAAWMLVPCDEARGLDKIRRVYETDEALSLACIGTTIAALGALVCCCRRGEI